MNKRQKKKQEKLNKERELLKLQWKNGMVALKNRHTRPEKDGYNIEGYKDPTASIAIENVSRRGY